MSWKDIALYSLYSCVGSRTAIPAMQVSMPRKPHVSPCAAHGPVTGLTATLSWQLLATWSHSPRTGGWSLATLCSQTSCGPASPGDLHTWGPFIGLGFSCDNQGLAAPGACLYLSVAVSQERGSGGRNCLAIRVEWACVPVQAGRPTHASHCSVVPVLSRGSLCDSLC